jgi:hypothetical protein
MESGFRLANRVSFFSDSFVLLCLRGVSTASAAGGRAQEREETRRVEAAQRSCRVPAWLLLGGGARQFTQRQREANRLAWGRGSGEAVMRRAADQRNCSPR